MLNLNSNNHTKKGTEATMDERIDTNNGWVRLVTREEKERNRRMNKVLNVLLIIATVLAACSVLACVL